MAKKNPDPVPKKAASPANKQEAAAGGQASWLDADSHQPMIEHYARRLGPFVEAMADGAIDRAELKSQELRLVTLMREVEPTLPADLHEKITQLLCELTAYNLMHILHEVQEARPKTTFQG
ncbi:MAG TPA: hypothetical protein VF278_05605 [Pirellulales bacterium]